MKVSFVQTGGLAGFNRSVQLNTATIPHEQAAELKRLVAESQLTGSAHALSADARDLREYEITIEDGTDTHSARFDDRTVPAAARPLIAFLRNASKPGLSG